LCDPLMGMGTAPPPVDGEDSRGRAAVGAAGVAAEEVDRVVCRALLLRGDSNTAPLPISDTCALSRD